MRYGARVPKRYTPNDNWSKRAQTEGYRARSVYKLMELDKQFRLLRPGMKVLDFGAAPGSWLQYVVEKVGPKGTALGFDLQEIAPIEGAKTYVADILDRELINKIIQENGITQVNMIFSDLAPSTTGIRDVDQWKSIELSKSVTRFAISILKPGGACVIKVLRGADFDEFLQHLKKTWKGVKVFIPQATRDRSTEVYVVMRR